MPETDRTTIRITGPASIIEAVPYLLGFVPADSLVLIGIRDRRVTVAARVDLDTLNDPNTPTDLMSALASTAESSGVIAITYGERAAAARIADTANRAGLVLLDHLRVADGRYWSLTCRNPDCCPHHGRPLPDDNATSAEFVGAGMTAASSRADLDAALHPAADADRMLPLLRDAQQTAQDAISTGGNESRRTADTDALFAAARREARDWTDDETARFAVALAAHEIRDAAWMAIDDNRLDGRDLFVHLSRTLPAPYRAPALFLFAWKTWREGNGTLAAMAVERALHADPTYSAAELLKAALTRGVDPRRMPTLRTASG